MQIIDHDLPNSAGAVIFKCFTLEPRGEDEIKSGLDKRIPQGKYKLRWHDSPKFKRRVLHLYNEKVPKNRYILVHNGNYPQDTEGCILLGMEFSDSGVFNSLKAFKEFMGIMLQSDIKNDVLEIINSFD